MSRFRGTEREGVSGRALGAVGALVLALGVAGCQNEMPAAHPAAEGVEHTSIEHPAAERAPTIGLDSLLLDEAFERASRMPRIYSLIVARHGEIARESYFNGASANRVANIKSASKSVISTLVGIAIEEGHLEGLDQPVLPFFPELGGVNDDPRIHGVTIGHLLAMQGGTESTSSRNYGAWAASSNWVRDALRRPFVAEPGGTMVYSTGSSHVLSAVLTRATGRSTLTFAREALFQPMGIVLSPWTRDPQGIYLGGNEMGLRPREMFLFGELHRNGGVHDGRRLVSDEWIRGAWVQRGTSRFNGHGHGLGWWIREYAGYDVYFAWGHGGQYVFIVPELELTVVTTSNPVGGRQGAPTRAIHDLLREVLIPAAERGGAVEVSEQ